MLKRIIAVVTLTLFSASVFAAESTISYDKISVGYQSSEVLSEDFMGFNVGFNAAISELTFLFGSYTSLGSRYDYNFAGNIGDISYDQFNFGFGFHTPFNDLTDYVMGVAYVNAELSVPSASDNGVGYLVFGGMRSKPYEMIELSALIAYSAIDSADEIGIKLEAQYYISSRFSAGLSYSTEYDIKGIIAVASYHF